MDFSTAIHLAVEYNNILILRMVIAYEFNLEVTTKGDNNTPLHIASSYSRKNFTRILLHRIRNVKPRRETDGYTPLFYAARSDHPEVLELQLSDMHVEINARGYGGRSIIGPIVANDSLKGIELSLTRKDFVIDFQDA